MKHFILFVTAFCFFVGSSVTVHSQQGNGQGGQKDSARLKDWHLSWDKFLKAFQNCLNDQSCKLEQFGEQTFTWEGVFKGIRKTEKGEVVDLEMTPGSMTDRKGQTVKVMNSLSPEPSEPETWRNLTVGEKVRFRGTNMGVPFGAGFIPLKNDCCFMVMFAGKAELIRDPPTQKK